MRNNIKAVYMALLAIMIWLALFIQFYISTVKLMSDGRTFGGSFIHLWSYFTIQNNFLVALAMTVMLLRPASKLGRLFAKPKVLTAMSVYIIIVGLVYQLVLRAQFTQYGWFAFCDEIFHTLSPPLFIVFWLIFVDIPKLPWRLAFNWLAYPLIYCFYVLIRGGVFGYYPYSFIDGNKLSYTQIFINCIFLLIAFLIIGLILIAVTHRNAKKQTATVLPVI